MVRIHKVTGLTSVALLLLSGVAGVGILLTEKSEFKVLFWVLFGAGMLVALTPFVLLAIVVLIERLRGEKW